LKLLTVKTEYAIMKTYKIITQFMFPVRVLKKSNN